ncbi:MAG: carbonic anhydrase [Ignavibacteriales bacterium]|nr:carbonic anhydrase [Ignavibacteriales bacterium]
MKKYKAVLFLIIITQFCFNLYAQHQSATDVNKLLAQLTDGNKRFVESKSSHPNQSTARIKETSKGQNPYAVVLTCSDSRVPPEIIFDQGLGDLFVIRTAGNLVDDIGLGSIEYAVEHLGIHLIVVLGHERCGAVEAAVKGGEAPGHIESLVKAIHPAVEKARKEKGDLVNNSVIANVRSIVEKLKSSEPILKEFVSEKKLEIIGARYDLDDGSVTIIH